MAVMGVLALLVPLLSTIISPALARLSGWQLSEVVIPESLSMTRTCTTLEGVFLPLNGVVLICSILLSYSRIWKISEIWKKQWPVRRYPKGCAWDMEKHLGHTQALMKKVKESIRGEGLDVEFKGPDREFKRTGQADGKKKGLEVWSHSLLCNTQHLVATTYWLVALLEFTLVFLLSVAKWGSKTPDAIAIICMSLGAVGFAVLASCTFSIFLLNRRLDRYLMCAYSWYLLWTASLSLEYNYTSNRGGATQIREVAKLPSVDFDENWLKIQGGDQEACDHLTNLWDMLRQWSLSKGDKLQQELGKPFGAIGLAIMALVAYRGNPQSGDVMLALSLAYMVESVSLLYSAREMLLALESRLEDFLQIAQCSADPLNSERIRKTGLIDVDHAENVRHRPKMQIVRNFVPTLDGVIGDYVLRPNVSFEVVRVRVSATELGVAAPVLED